MIGSEPWSPVDLEHLFVWDHNFVTGQKTLLGSVTKQKESNSCDVYECTSLCGNSQRRRRRRATRVSVERQVFAVDLGVLGCPRVLCVTIPTGVSVTETSRGGSAKHGEQLRSRSGCVLQFSACAVIAVDMRQFHHLSLSMSCIVVSGFNTKCQRGVIFKT